MAVEAVGAAGDVVRQWWGHEVRAERKGRGDYVTAADRAAEAAALGVLRRRTPTIAVLAEESVAVGATIDDRPVWAVDPLDGTTNFLRGFPVVGVSIGLLVDGRPVAGAVGAPLLGEVWSAALGRGAHDLQGRRLSVRDDGGRGVAATGFPFRRPENRPRYLAVFEAALAEMEDLRRPGAASLDLAYTAAGAFDGFFELGLATWDVAAGTLLVREAGGVVSDWEGDEEAVLRSGDILAGSPTWHERMLGIVAACAKEGR